MEHMKLYSNGCPKCKMVESLFKSKEVPYVKVSNTEEILRVSNNTQIREMPILKVGNTHYSGTEAVKYVKAL